MNFHPLSPIDMQVLDGLAQGKRYREIGRRTGLKVHSVKQRLQRIKSLTSIEATQKDPRVLLAQWWTSDIFRAGLEELGLLPSNHQRVA